MHVSISPKSFTDRIEYNMETRTENWGTPSVFQGSVICGPLPVLLVKVIRSEASIPEFDQ